MLLLMVLDILGASKDPTAEQVPCCDATDTTIRKVDPTDAAVRHTVLLSANHRLLSHAVPAPPSVCFRHVEETRTCTDVSADPKLLPTSVTLEPAVAGRLLPTVNDAAAASYDNTVEMLPT